MLRHPFDPALRWPRILLGAAVALVLAVCVFPYQLETGSWRPFSAELVDAEKGAEDAVRDVVVNVLLFVPFGVGMAATSGHRLRVTGRVALTVGTAAVLSLAVESLQMYLPSRDPSLRDVAANVGGAALGGLLFLGREAQVSAICGAVAILWRRLWLIDRPGRLLSIYLLGALLAAGSLQASTRLSNWSLAFPLLIGNEATGDRPWAGWIRELEISDETLDHRRAVAAVSARLEELLPGSVVLSQRFPDRELPAAAMAAGFAWQGPPRQVPAPVSTPGLFVSGTRWLRSHEAGRLVGDALRRANRFTLKLACRAASVNQEGPARIVSVSTDPYRRNLTIGQEGSALVVRLRTPMTGPNGREPELVKPHVFDRDGDRTILITYDGATLAAYVDGTRHWSRLELSPGAVLVNSLSSPNSLDLPGYTVLFLALVSGPAGILLALTLPRRRPLGPGAVLAVAGFSLLLAGGLDLVLVLVSGRPPSFGHVATGAILCSTAAIGASKLRG